MTKSQYGSGYRYGPMEPCYEEPCPDPEMQYTAGTEEFLSFVSAAMLDLHSQDFLDEVTEASDSGEVSTQGAWGCGASVIGYVASFAPFVTCPTVVGCVGAIIMHKVAVVGLICSCMTDC